MKYPLIVKKKLNNNQWLFDIYDDPQDHYDEASSLAIIKMVFGCWAWLLTEMLFVHLISHVCAATRASSAKFLQVFVVLTCQNHKNKIKLGNMNC